MSRLYEKLITQIMEYTTPTGRNNR